MTGGRAVGRSDRPADGRSGGQVTGRSLEDGEHQSAAGHVTEERASAPADPLTDRPTARPPARVNILLVDDQPANLIALEAMLQGLGQNLIKADSGREALEVAAEQRVRRWCCWT